MANALTLLASNGEAGRPDAPGGSRKRSTLRSIGGTRITADVATVYLIIALLWGFVLVGLVPSFQVPDEPGHFFRAWQLAQLSYGSVGDGLVEIPSSVALLPTELGSGSPSGAMLNGYSPERVRRYLLAPIGTRVGTVDNAATYGPIGYLPHLLPIELARLAGRGALAAFYAARVLNLLAATLLTYLAIRIIPVGKLLIAALGLLPMTMYETASVSPDALAIAGSFLFVALVIRSMSREHLDRGDVVVLSVAAALGLNAKPGYALLVIAALAIPKVAFGSWRRYLTVMALVIGATAVVAGALLVTTPARSPDLLVPFLGVDHNVDPARQLDHVLSQPWAFAEVLRHTADKWSYEYVVQFFGRFGWATFSLPFAAALLMLVVLVVAFRSQEEYAPEWWQRGVLVTAAALAVVTVALGLYLGYTPVGFRYVNGIQGRYFIPCAPFLLFGLYRMRVVGIERRPIVVFSAVGVVAIAMILTILQFYYL